MKDAISGQSVLPGNRTPQRGNLLTRLVGKGVFRLLGWRIEGQLPDREKFILLVAPHTSNWDFVVGIAAVLGLGLNAKWLGKDVLFKGYHGKIMVWLGGIPVDRSEPQGTIQQMVRISRAQDNFLLGITPEGTRSRTDRWRSGFYHIAKATDLPIVPITMDYPSRTIRIGSPIVPTGDLDKDLQVFRDFFKDANPKIPENFNRDIRF